MKKYKAGDLVIIKANKYYDVYWNNCIGIVSNNTTLSIAGKPARMITILKGNDKGDDHVFYNTQFNEILDIDMQLIEILYD